MLLPVVWSRNQGMGPFGHHHLSRFSSRSERAVAAPAAELSESDSLSDGSWDTRTLSLARAEPSLSNIFATTDGLSAIT